MKKVLYILFHRSVLVALSLLAQVVTLVVMLNIFSEYINNFYWCCIVLSVIAALLILGSRIEPAYKIAWLLLILPFPVFGGVFTCWWAADTSPSGSAAGCAACPSSRKKTCGRTSRRTICSLWGRTPPGQARLSGALCPLPRLYQH